MANKLRYEVKPRPDYKQDPGYTHMVVDVKKRIAVKFSTLAKCEAEAFRLNDGGQVV